MPILENEFPQHIDRLAAGLVAAGSACSSNDDIVSRDSSWGPRFHVYLSQSDYDEVGRSLQTTLDHLPREFYGTSCCPSDGFSPCRAYAIDAFFDEKVGKSTAPLTAIDWLRIPEERLFEITHGQVFYDPLREFSDRRSEFALYYPDDVWRKRLAARLNQCGIQGQQLLVESLGCGDYYTAQMAWWGFVQAAIKLGFLLSRRYSPNQKWLHREFCKLPEPVAEVSNLLWEGQSDFADRPLLVSQIAMIYDAAILDLGLVTSLPPSLSNSFTQRAEEISAAISDPSIAKLSLHVDLVQG